MRCRGFSAYKQESDGSRQLTSDTVASKIHIPRKSRLMGSQLARDRKLYRSCEVQLERLLFKTKES